MLAPDRFTKLRPRWSKVLFLHTGRCAQTLNPNMEKTVKLTVRQGLGAAIVPAPGSPSRMELIFCGTSGCEVAQLFPSIIVNNASSHATSQHLVGVFLEAFTFAKNSTKQKKLKLLRNLICREVSILVIFPK